ncbi:hypothetical protein WR25_03926 [Diploscapter pachys]|uniref:DNA-directed DNA polymerase n=1 Tax=Diploscapter pachys TaxID=2018661 RepID=A0A2A2J1M8_9BILA|nr:hypothetical protein WR25_03926 [Diploscapter pachys]
MHHCLIAVPISLAEIPSSLRQREGREIEYSWCSDRLINHTPLPQYFTCNLRDFYVPVAKQGEKNSRIVIGHNVGFDRARTQSPYEKEPTGVLFMDTMAMVASMLGMADHQETMYKTRRAQTDGMDDSDPALSQVGPIEGNSEDQKGDGWIREWKKRVSPKGLADVHKYLYPNKKPLDKQYQNFFVKCSLPDVREKFQILMKYCAHDVLATAQIYAKLMPMFQEKIPHPISLAGMVYMGDAYLPINQHWRQFYQASNIEAKMNVLISEERERVPRIEDGSDEISHYFCEEYDPTHSDERRREKRFVVLDRGLQSLHKAVRTSEVRFNILGIFSCLNHYFKSHEIMRLNMSEISWYQTIFKQAARRETPIENLKPDDITFKTKASCPIFGFVYGPYPMLKIDKFGFGFLVPTTKAVKEIPEFMQLEIPSEGEEPFDFPIRKCAEFVRANLKTVNDVEKSAKPAIDWGDLKFYRLPHSSGLQENVGDMYSKSFYKLFGNLIRPTRNVEYFGSLLKSIQDTKFWDSYSERINEEISAWYEDSPPIEDGAPSQGVIAPAICPAGTVSRRSVHKLWVTLTNATESSRLGTGIKTMVQAPPGYKLVGADVDSQEQWIVALFGDASQALVKPVSERIAGLTPFSNMMLVGSKNDGTDLHSVVAKQLGISRDLAKTLNYARLYGSGVQHAKQELIKTGKKPQEATKVAKQLFALTKGELMQWTNIKPEYNDMWFEFAAERGFDGFKNCVVVDGVIYLPHSHSSFRKIADEFELFLMKKLKDKAARGFKINFFYEDIQKDYYLFYGGYESSTFNWLAMHSSSPLPHTPVLKATISTALQPLDPSVPDASNFLSKYKRSIMNWHVQSSAVDFLHLLLVSMRWLCSKYDIPARFVISIHDEVRYLVPKEDAPRLSLALMIAHMHVRAYMSNTVGIEQLPLSVAFFSKVDVDTVLRKEPTLKCENPDGTRPEDGQGWTIEDVLRLTGGSLRKPSTNRIGDQNSGNENGYEDIKEAKRSAI